MRPHPKIRKTVKWGGAAASVLLAVVWVGSGWHWVGFTKKQGFLLNLGAGWLSLYIPHREWNYYARTEWTWTREEFGLHWDFLYFHSSIDRSYHTPLWVFFVPLVSTTVAAWWLDRRTRRWALIGACTKCGYDRAGLAPDAVCPECGAGAGQAELNAKGAKGSKMSAEGSGK